MGALGYILHEESAINRERPQPWDRTSVLLRCRFRDASWSSPALPSAKSFPQYGTFAISPEMDAILASLSLARDVGPRNLASATHSQ